MINSSPFRSSSEWTRNVQDNSPDAPTDLSEHSPSVWVIASVTGWGGLLVLLINAYRCEWLSIMSTTTIKSWHFLHSTILFCIFPWPGQIVDEVTHNTQSKWKINRKPISVMECDANDLRIRTRIGAKWNLKTLKCEWILGNVGFPCIVRVE